MYGPKKVLSSLKPKIKRLTTHYTPVVSIFYIYIFYKLQVNTTFIMNPLDPKEFRRQGHMIIDFLADYYQNIANYPVLSQVEPGYLRKLMPSCAPLNPEPIETILQDLQQHIVPGITHWQSPNYFAYFPSSGSTAGFLGEMLSTGFNLVGFNWVSSPAATELESSVMDWLGQVLKLPEAFLFSSGSSFCDKVPINTLSVLGEQSL
ncbi:Tyrosine/DOPA decarboxylase 2 [Spatholobus suberectus]|nr:Tyrosine/DOPA decarboxylase 2 [Spatholobus suberectus]